jgi:hypothetical protein
LPPPVILLCCRLGEIGLPRLCTANK